MEKIGIIAPSGVVENFDEKCVEDFFNSKGIEVKIFPSCYERFRYMAGADNLRLNDIHSAFMDPTIDTIICARGGYGAIRIIDDINYNLIRDNKKNFVGFSDITTLLISFYKNANLKSFHGKMAINGILDMDDTEFAIYMNSILNPSFESKLKGGILWGGNLTTICSLFGSSRGTYLPDENIILFIEDINEPDYKIDRMFQQILRNRMLKDKIKGVIFGDFMGTGKYIDEIKAEFAEKLNVPYETNLNITHGNKNIVVPFGYPL